MDALSRAIGAACPVSLGGEMYLLAPITLETIGIIENYLLVRRPTPLESIQPMLGRLPEGEFKRGLIAGAEAELKAKPLLRIVTSDAFYQFIDSADGILLTCWLCLRKHHQEFSVFSQARRVWDTASEAEKVALIKTRNHISGFSILNILDWPQPEDQIPAEVLARRKRAQGESYQRWQWRLNFHRLMNGFGGMCWADLKELTIYNFRMLCSEEKELTFSTLNLKPGKKYKDPIRVNIGRDGSGVEEYERLTREYRQLRRCSDRQEIGPTGKEATRTEGYCEGTK